MLGRGARSAKPNRNYQTETQRATLVRQENNDTRVRLTFAGVSVSPTRRRIPRVYVKWVLTAYIRAPNVWQEVKTEPE